jgi:hypothetical protein
LSEGQKIVVNGLQRVSPGMAVTPKEEVASRDDLRVAKH